MFFGQADDGEIVETQSLQLATRRRKLPFPSIDDDEVGKTNERWGIADCGLRDRIAF